MPKRLTGCFSTVSIEEIPFEEPRSGRSIEDETKSGEETTKGISKLKESRFSSKSTPGYRGGVEKSRTIVGKIPSQTEGSSSNGAPGEGKAEIAEKGCQTTITAIAGKEDVLAKISPTPSDHDTSGMKQSLELKEETSETPTTNGKVNGTAEEDAQESDKDVILRARKLRSLSYSAGPGEDDGLGFRERSVPRRSSAPAVHGSKEKKTWKREISINEDSPSEVSEDESKGTAYPKREAEGQVDKRTQVSELEIIDELKRAATLMKPSPKSRTVRKECLEKIPESEGSSGSSTSDTSESSSDSSDSDDSLEDYGKVLIEDYPKLLLLV